MLTYILMVDHIVTIARSSKILRKSFDEDLVKWKESDPDYKIEKDEFIKKVKLSNKKMEICLEDVFEGRMQSGFLKFRHPK